MFFDPRGVTLVEFAIVGPLLLTTIFMSMQFALQLLAQWTLDTGVIKASRDVMMGNIYSQNSNSQQLFINDVCSQVALIASCSTSLNVNLATGSSFYAITPATVNSSGKFTPQNFNLAGLNTGQFVLVQVAYQMPYMISWLSKITGGSSIVLLSTVALQNEPYSQ